MQLRNSRATNMEAWKRDITTLWMVKMSDSNYLKNLVEWMQRILLRGTGPASNIETFMNK